MKESKVCAAGTKKKWIDSSQAPSLITWLLQLQWRGSPQPPCQDSVATAFQGPVGDRQSAKPRRRSCRRTYTSAWQCSVCTVLRTVLLHQPVYTPHAVERYKRAIRYFQCQRHKTDMRNSGVRIDLSCAQSTSHPANGHSDEVIRGDHREYPFAVGPAPRYSTFYVPSVRILRARRRVSI